jgi:hypothetical protein
MQASLDLVYLAKSSVPFMHASDSLDLIFCLKNFYLKNLDLLEENNPFVQIIF